MEFDLGRFFLCLSVGDVRRSLDFYEILGFKHVEGAAKQGWAVETAYSTFKRLFGGMRHGQEARLHRVGAGRKGRTVL